MVSIRDSLYVLVSLSALSAHVFAAPVGSRVQDLAAVAPANLKKASTIPKQPDGRLKKRVIDGSLNNPSVLSKIQVANFDINADISIDENRNANTRADGKKNNSIIS
ncbi:hypothetical protein TWF132_003829 [Orbilia oligospora]|nr:hypothetical protein TWF751_010338 [Orbilia oligospora]KAF3293942.1 hypothetical protein TWF132_003829 [Orbilia oligospora]